MKNDYRDFLETLTVEQLEKEFEEIHDYDPFNLANDIVQTLIRYQSQGWDYLRNELSELEMKAGELVTNIELFE